MKKINLILGVFSLSALTFFSCKKDDKAGTAGDMMSFTASIGGGAKTEINGFDMKWSGGEIIYINGEEFTGEKEGDGKTAVFTGETVDSPYKAYFLADYTKEGEYYKLPATQTYDGNNLSKVNPMYAESNTTDLQFHNICAMLELNVKGQGTVKEIVVTATDGKLLSGAFKVSTTGGKYFAEVLSGGSNTVTLNCGEGVELKAEKDTTFYIALPQGNYTDLKFELKNGSAVWDTTLSMNFKAGQIRTKELTGVKFVNPVPEDCISGEFTINDDGDRVYFSKGNLIYDATASKKWTFYENQTDYAPDYEENPISMFTWGYGEWSTNPSTEDCQTGEFTDWGKAIDDKGTWRTLSSDEWEYLLRSRDGASSFDYWGKTCQWVTVGSTKGLILYPDDYSGTKFGNNATITSIPEGCVFLPAAVYREGGSVSPYYGGSAGSYWSCSYDDSGSPYSMTFRMIDATVTTLSHVKSHGLPVRLVQDVK